MKGKIRKGEIITHEEDPILSFEGKVSKSGDRLQINIPKTLHLLTKKELVEKRLYIIIYKLEDV